jgi:hypothetical protein
MTQSSSCRLARSFDLSSPRFGNECGQAIAEFTIIAITFFFVLLGVIQLAMVLNAFSLVRYAAYNAARAAIVHGGDQQAMEEAARLSLLAVFPRHGRADHRRGYMENYLGARLTDNQVWVASHRPAKITEVKIINIGSIGCNQTITFDDPAQAARGLITVQVLHRYELVIPLVNRMVVWLWHKLDTGGAYRGESLDYIAAETHRMRKPGGEFFDVEYRIPLVAHYTMRMQSDLVTANCPPPPPPPPSPSPSPLPSSRTYLNPTMNGYPLDMCLNFATNCNQPPADLFCQRNGWRAASSFAIGAPVAQTYVPGDNVVCDWAMNGYSYYFCHPFTSITCVR